jgi:hypothetical protein
MMRTRYKVPEKRAYRVFLTFLCGHWTLYYGSDEKDALQAKSMVHSIACPNCEFHVEQWLQSFRQEEEDEWKT